MHVSVFPCLSHLSWPRRATGPSKSPMVSWGCDSSASPNLMKLTHWCTKTQFHLFDIYKFPQKNTQNTHALKHFTIFPFHTFQIFFQKNSTAWPTRFPGCQGTYLEQADVANADIDRGWERGNRPFDPSTWRVLSSAKNPYIFVEII